MNRLRLRPSLTPARVATAIAVAAVALWLPLATPAAAQLTEQIPDDIWESFVWRSVGPTNMGGRVTDVEGLASPSKTFYVAGAAGGIWKTTNNGITFRSIFNDPRVIAMGDLAIAPSDPSQIWAGTARRIAQLDLAGRRDLQVHRRRDSWEFKGLRETRFIGNHRAAARSVSFCGGAGHIWDANPERGLYRTTTAANVDLSQEISDKAGFVTCLPPRHPSTLFAASWSANALVPEERRPRQRALEVHRQRRHLDRGHRRRLPNHDEGPDRDCDQRERPRHHVHDGRG